MKPRLVIAGAGAVGLTLAKRTVLQWTPILIDIDPLKCEAAAGIEGLHVECGDATSTLILKRANVKGATYAVATTGDDEVNAEFCRLMRDQFGAHNLVAIGNDRGSSEKLREAGATAISRPASVASILESSLDGGRRVASDVGLGKGEICQVTVQSHSPVIGKTLRQLRPRSWLLGAIYRDGRLVVPHGNTAIQSGDKCLLVGEPSVLVGISDYFQSGSSEFPLQFGTRFGLIEQGPLGLPDLAEAGWLTEHTEATGAVVLHRGPEPPADLPTHFPDGVETRRLPEQPRTDLAAFTEDLDCGTLIVSPCPKGWKDKLGLGNRPLFDLLNSTSEPVLVSRGSHPYKRILVAVSPSPGSMRAAELAVDVARKLEAELTAIAVEPPDFVVGEEYKKQLQDTLEAVKSKAHLYGRRLETRLVPGNPVTQVLEQTADFDLLIVAHRRHRRFTLTRPDSSRHIIVDAPCSVMVLPFQASDLSSGS